VRAEREGSSFHRPSAELLSHGPADEVGSPAPPTSVSLQGQPLPAEQETLPFKGEGLAFLLLSPSSPWKHVHLNLMTGWVFSLLQSRSFCVTLSCLLT
jgi:hypothetical protein